MNIGGIRGTSHLGVNFLGGTFVHIFKLFLYISGAFGELLRSLVVGKSDGQRRRFDFLFEKIFLVEKKNDGSIGKPSAEEKKQEYPMIEKKIKRGF